MRAVTFTKKTDKTRGGGRGVYTGSGSGGDNLSNHFGRLARG